MFVFKFHVGYFQTIISDTTFRQINASVVKWSIQLKKTIFRILLELSQGIVKTDFQKKI